MSPLNFLNTEFQKQEKTFVLLALGVKVIKIPAFTESFWALYARVNASYPIMTLAASPCVGKSLMMTDSSWSTWLTLAVLSMANSEPNTNSSYFLLTLSKLEWLHNRCDLWEGKRIYKWCRSQSPGMAKPAEWPFPTVNNSNKFDLGFDLNHQTISYVAQESAHLSALIIL